MINKKIIVLLFVLFSFSSCRFYTGGGGRVRPYSLAETVWKYTDKDWTYSIKFNRDGTISSTHPRGNRPFEDRWRQKGKKVFFYLSNGYSSYKGKFKNDLRIEGRARNSKTKWEWTLERLDVE